MSLPQRHGPVQYDNTQVLQLPQEIVDLIESAIRINRYRCILALRLSCRTFAEGLLHALFKPDSGMQYLHSFTIYLDDQGIEDVEWLANSRFAPFVRDVKLADRVPSRVFLQYWAKDAETSNEDFPIPTFIKSVYAHESGVGNYIRRVPIKHQFSQDQPLGVLSSKRGERQLANLAASFPNYDIRWKSTDCVAARGMDLRPSSTSLQRLAIAMNKFVNLEDISTFRGMQVNASALTAKGELLHKTALHAPGRYHSCGEAENHLLDCACRDNADNKARFICARKTEGIVWPTSIELALLSPLLLLSLPLFQKLTKLHLNFYTEIIIEAVPKFENDTAPDLAKFIARCSALEELTLSANKSNEWKLVPIIQVLVQHLSQLDAYFPHLRNLQLDDTDPSQDDVTAFIVAHSNTLEFLNLPSCPPPKSSFDPSYVANWIKLFEAFSTAQALRKIELRWFDQPRSDRENVIRKSLTRLGHGTASIGCWPEMKEWMATFAGKMRDWDGQNWGLCMWAGRTMYEGLVNAGGMES